MSYDSNDISRNENVKTRHSRHQLQTIPAYYINHDTDSKTEMSITRANVCTQLYSR